MRAHRGLQGRRTGAGCEEAVSLAAMKPSWKELSTEAQLEVQETLSLLPEALQTAARGLPVVYERRPNERLIDDGLDPDLLGLFVGEPHGSEAQGTGGLPAQILLFLENLWEFAEGDWEIFLDEVQTTYLHELGHYLGLDEVDLEERGLE